VTSPGHPYAELRALKNGNVWVAEAVARELPRPLSLEDALKLTYLYAEKEQWEKFERAAMKWLRRYIAQAILRAGAQGEPEITVTEAIETPDQF
jgi:hypothetical protein